jgi:hypothetical protein
MEPPAIIVWLWTKKEWMRSLFNKNVKKPKYEPNEVESSIISQNTKNFIEENIDVFPRKARCSMDFHAIDALYKYDAYVVGSDQVWRPRYNSNMVPSMFLNFVKRENVMRIAYAASFGTDNWEYSSELTGVCADLIKKFNLITVREKSGVKLCKDYLEVEATHVLDPTMLLNPEDYVKLITNEYKTDSDGTLFYYILDPTAEKKAFIENVARDQDLKLFTVMPKYQAENRTRNDVKKHIDDCVFPSVSCWLQGFLDANMVIVDSFHGAVFSIIFNKPFWVLGNKERGNTRFESLLGLFNLEDRMITISDNMDWNKPIDWERVNEKRMSEQIRCIDLLDTELRNMK